MIGNGEHLTEMMIWSRLNGDIKQSEMTVRESRTLAKIKNYTRNRIVSMIKPFLSTVQAGRGIQDFLVICDTTNNTPDVISRNQLIVDVYIKPTYVAEFILLR